jgi:hypothetical protein
LLEARTPPSALSAKRELRSLLLAPAKPNDDRQRHLRHERQQRSVMEQDFLGRKKKGGALCSALSAKEVSLA